MCQDRPPAISTAPPVNKTCRYWSNMFEKDQKAAAEEVARRVGFGPKEIPFWYDNFHPEIEKEIKASIELAAVFPPSFILAGPVGTGKSGMLSAAFKHWVTDIFGAADGTIGSMISGIARYCIFLTHNDFIDIVMGELNDNDYSGPMTVEQLKAIPFVIIDDLLNGSATPYQLSRLEDFIDHRYSHGMATWFSTNIKAKDLKGWPGLERSYSRLADKTWCRYFQLNGADRRKMIQPPSAERSDG